MKISFSSLLCFILLSSAGAFAEPLKVGFVYLSPAQDAGWTYAHEKARLYVEKELGDKIQTTFIENVNEGSDAERVIHKLASSGYSLIFTTSFGFMNPTFKVAQRFKNIKFEHATGYKTASNMGVYNARPYQGRYLTGLIAGKMTRTNVVGYIATFPIPEVIRGINAFTKGLKETNPDAVVKVVWISSWYDPAKERVAAETLILQGADILSTHADSPTTVQTAEAKGVYAFGYHSDMSKYGKHAQLTAVVHNWGQLYLNEVKSVLNNTWKPENLWYGLKEGVTQLSAFNKAVPKEVQDLVNTRKEQIIKGEKRVFDGPVYNQAGELVVKKDNTISDSDLLTMNWYIQGIEGTLPGH